MRKARRAGVDLREKMYGSLVRIRLRTLRPYDSALARYRTGTQYGIGTVSKRKAALHITRALEFWLLLLICCRAANRGRRRANIVSRLLYESDRRKHFLTGT